MGKPKYLMVPVISAKETDSCLGCAFISNGCLNKFAHTFGRGCFTKGTSELFIAIENTQEAVAAYAALRLEKANE